MDAELMIRKLDKAARLTFGGDSDHHDALALISEVIAALSATPQAAQPEPEEPWLDRLKWATERRLTRDYRMVTLGEHECRQILSALVDARDPDCTTCGLGLTPATPQAAQAAQAAQVPAEPVLWALRDARTKAVYWDDEQCCMFLDKESAEQSARDMNEEIDDANFEAFALYADQQPQAAQVPLLPCPVCGGEAIAHRDKLAGMSINFRPPSAPECCVPAAVVTAYLAARDELEEVQRPAGGFATSVRMPHGDARVVAYREARTALRAAVEHAKLSAEAQVPLPPQPVEVLGTTCADGGKCHHHCNHTAERRCFRRECCSPLTGYAGPWAYPKAEEAQASSPSLGREPLTSITIAGLCVTLSTDGVVINAVRPQSPQEADTPAPATGTPVTAWAKAQPSHAPPSDPSCPGRAP